MSDQQEWTCTSKLVVLSSEVWACGAFIPEHVHSAIRSHEIDRLWCELNEKEKFSCALMPGGENSWFININKERQKKLKIQPGDDVTLRLTPNTSKYGMEISEEFEELLSQDEEGSHYFHQLTPGRQRGYVLHFSQPKQSATRVSRIDKAAPRILAGKGMHDR